MYPVKEFEKRFREVLEALDEIRNDADDTEELDELNAQFEDALFVIECIAPDEEEWREEFTDALDEFKDLCDGYRALENPAAAASADRLESLIRLAEANLPVE